MRVDRFKPEDMLEIGTHDAQQLGRFASINYMQMLASAGTALTIRDDKIVLCAGVVDYGFRRGSLWAVMSPETGKKFVAIHRMAKRFIESLCMERIEATVEAGFVPGCRWLTMLGFKLETPEPMRAFAPDGKAHYLYGWVP